MLPADYIMVLPVRHFRVSDHLVALESAFTEHLRMLRLKLGEAVSRLVIVSPAMSVASYEKIKQNLSIVDEATEQIAFRTVFSDDSTHSTREKVKLFLPVMRCIYRLVQRSSYVYSGLSWLTLLPFEFAAVVFALLLRRRTGFVVDIDYRRSAYMDYQIGNRSLASYLVCKYLYDTVRSAQIWIAVRCCSLVLLKGQKMTADFGKGRLNVKNILDASHSEENIIDPISFEEKLKSLSRSDLPLRLVYFGRLVAYKGVDRCLTAVAWARQTGSNVTLDIIGSGDQADALHKMARDLNANKYVTFHDPRPFDQDFFQVLYGFHLLLAAPLREDTPRSALDAMAAGIPFLAFDTYYYRDFLESGVGEVVPWLDVQSMANSLMRLAANRARVQTMAENAVEFARLNTQEIWLERRVSWTLSMDVIEEKR